jgi:hypothetical protein
MMESERRCHRYRRAALRCLGRCEKNLFLDTDMPQQTFSKRCVRIEIDPLGIGDSLSQ